MSYFAGPYFAAGVAVVTPEPEPVVLAAASVGPNRERVRGAIVDLALAGPFYATTYPDSGTVRARPQRGASVSPQTCEVNEVSSSFVTAHTRRVLARDRQEWSFELLLAFAQETSIEEWERRLTTRPVRIPEAIVSGETRTSKAGFLELVSCDYTHPPRAGGGSSFRVIFTMREFPS